MADHVWLEALKNDVRKRKALAIGENVPNDELRCFLFGVEIYDAMDADRCAMSAFDVSNRSIVL